MDLLTIVGVLLAALALLGANALEGGQLSTLMQPTAALVVLGGTLAAVAIQFPRAAWRSTFVALRELVASTGDRASRDETIQMLVAMAGHAQRRGVRLLAGVAETLEGKGDRAHLRRALHLVARSTPTDTLREALEVEIDRTERAGEQAVRLIRSAGGYAPTMGILGAVLGLIQVMNNITDPSRLGSGIAVAFVATVYGLATANLFLLPLAGRVRERLDRRLDEMELVLEGTCSIANGDDARVVGHKLRAFGAAREDGGRRARAQEAATA